MKSNTIYYLFLGILVVECRKDDINLIPTNDKPKPKVLIEKTLFVRALDKNNKLLTRSEIHIQDKTSSADAWGVLITKNLFDKERLTFTVTHPGYFPSYYGSKPLIKGNQLHSRKLSPLQTKRLQTIKETKTTLTNNNYLIIPSMSFEQQSQIEFKGEIYLDYYDYNLSNEIVSEYFPPDYQVENQNKEIKTLQFHNLFRIQVKDIFSGQLSMKKELLYYGELQNYEVSGLDSMNVYKFDEENMLWKFYNKAKLNGAQLICRLNHSGSFACATESPIKYIYGNISSINSKYIPSGKLKIFTNNNTLYKTIEWNDKAEWNIAIANDANYTIRYMDCKDNIISELPINASVDYTLPIHLDLKNAQWSLVEGKAINCNNQSVLKAYILNLSDQSSFFTLTDSSGEFFLAYDNCTLNQLKLLKTNYLTTEFSLELLPSSHQVVSNTPFNCQSGEVFIELPNKIVKSIDNCNIKLLEVGIDKKIEFISFDKVSGTEYLVTYKFENTFYPENVSLMIVRRGKEFFQLINYKNLTKTPQLQVGKKVELKLFDCTLKDEKGNIINNAFIHCAGTLQ